MYLRACSRKLHDLSSTHNSLSGQVCDTVILGRGADRADRADHLRSGAAGGAGGAGYWNQCASMRGS